jgi:uncharacterized protein with beta-barrel porin domain
MGMSVSAPGRARTRRLASLLASTALVSAALSMSVNDASAACTVTAAGTVDCLANTTTTDTINTNGTTAASIDKRQEFDNGSNITGTVANGVTVNGFGLELALTNAGGNNTITFTNSGTVAGLNLIGNGGLVTYTGNGTASIGAAITNVGTGGVTVTNNGVFGPGGNNGVFVHTQGAGPINVNGSGTFAGGQSGVFVLADDNASINVTSAGAISGGTASGINASSAGGSLLVATGSTVSGGNSGIRATTLGSGTVTVTTGGAVTGTSQWGILTGAANGNTSVNAGHNVTAGTVGIQATGFGSGLVDVNHTAGTITAGTIAISASQSSTGAIDISQTGGALNGTTQAVSASMTGSGNVIVSLTGGTVGSTSGNVINTSATTGTTTITTDVNLTSTGGAGISAQSSGTINIGGNGTVSGQTSGIKATSFGSFSDVKVTSGGAIVGVTGAGIDALSTNNGSVLVATGSTVSGGTVGISAQAHRNVTVTTGGAVTGTSQQGILTFASEGTTTVNVGHDVTGGTEGIQSTSGFNGRIDIHHTAGTIAAGTIGIDATGFLSGTVDISQTGGALNGTTGAVSASTGFGGNVIVSLTGGTVGNVSGNAIETSAGTGSTTITSGVAITSTAANAIKATATSGNIAITNSSVITGATNAVFGSTSGIFDITNNGTLNGNVNVTGSNAASTFANSGIWNAGTASTFSGSLNNTGTVNVQNGAAGQVITLSGNYSGNGAYRVDVDAAGNADRMNVGGTANLTGGSVNALFLPGAYVSRNYTILSATSGLGGTTFTGGLTTNGLPAGFVAFLSYTPTAVLLDLAAFLGTGGNLNQNQQNVASTINNFFNNGGALPPGFVTVFGLTGSALGNALTQLSGEPATGAQQGAFQLGNSYLSLLTDPFATNRVRADGAIGFAESSSAVPAPVRAAFAAYTKAPPVAAYAPGWDVWGAAFGGTNNTRGETATVGSNNAYTRAGGVAAGVDYRFSPNALIGVSLAGGNINWSLTGNGVNGGGTSDAFLAGIYGKYSAGQAYVSGALTYSNYWTSTNRTVTVAGLDQLRADYNAHGFGGRLEGGYRLPVAYGDIVWTPYGAVQGQSFSTPNYGETAVSGSNQFALNFTGRTATAWRGELGLRTDKTMPIDNGSQLNLFGRFAYAHDEISNPAAAANFTTLGFGAAPFTVYGARPSRDLALTTAGAEWRLANGVSFLAKFDGEFGDRSQTYTATGRLRYTW